MTPARPTSAPPRPFTFPQIHRRKLDNGLTVVAVPVPGRTLVAADLVTDAGSAFDQTEGTATLLAKAFNEGTVERDAAAFADASEALGMQLAAGASWDSLSLSLTAPVSRLADSLALMAEAAWTPAIPEDGFQRIKAERLVQIQQEKANATIRAALEFPKHIYAEGSTYRRSLRGTADSVSSLTRDLLIEHHERYVSPGSCTLVVAGGADPDTIFELAESAFGGFTRPEGDRKAATSSPSQQGVRIVLVDRPGSVQSNLVVGHSCVARIEPTLDALKVAMYIFGGSFSSRINQRLREELGYTYGARADVDARRVPGPLVISTPVQANSTAHSLEEILKITQTFVSDGITAEELDASRDYLSGIFPVKFETTDAIAASVANLAIYGLPDEDLTTFPERIRAVTMEQAQAAARDHIKPDQLSMIVVGPAAEIQKDLESIAPVTVVTD